VVVLALIGAASYFVNYEVQLFNSVVGNGTSVAQIQFSQYQIPAAESSYACQGYNLAPQLGLRKAHAISFIAFLDNAQLAHHMTIYGCSAPIPEESFECNQLPANCTQFIWAWSPANDLIYDMPPEAAYPFGGANGYEFVVFQIFYYNPMLLSGQVDSSGVTIVLSTVLRTYDVGVYTITLTDFQIPPNNSDYTISGRCNGNSTGTLFSEGPVSVFAVSLQAHALATQVYTEQYRHGVFYDFLGSNMYYNFLTGFRALTPVQLSIEPTDSLLLYCHYDSINQTIPTGNGVLLQQELCTNYVYYYPAVTTVALCDTSLS